QASAFGPMNTSRYLFPFVAATGVLVASSIGRGWPGVAIGAMAVSVHVVACRDWIHSTFETYVKNAYTAFHETQTDHDAFDNVTGDYRDIQSHLPAGATAATAVFEGYRFDFQRNDIYALDVLGGMGPKPGWPAHLGAGALDRYFHDNGIPYLIWVDWNL